VEGVLKLTAQRPFAPRSFVSPVILSRGRAAEQPPRPARTSRERPRGKTRLTRSKEGAAGPQTGFVCPCCLRAAP